MYPQYVFQDALLGVVTGASPGGGGGDAPAPDDLDELESDQLDDQQQSSFLPLLDLDLTFSPPNGEQALVAALSSSPNTPLHPLSLTKVNLLTLRDNNKTPHRLYIRHAQTNAALVELNPLDPACFAAHSFVSWISPPPLTKSGKPFKSRAAAKRAVQPPARAVVPTGGGGLVDALALYAELGEAAEGVRVSASLSIELTPESRIQLHLHLTAALNPARFLPAAYSRPRRILLDFLLPSTAPSASSRDSDTPREAGIDYFYACLGRAPRTEGGLPVVRAARSEAERAARRDEREAQARRDAKGKGKAREVSPGPEGEDDHGEGDEEEEDRGQEDEPLYPLGLTVPLMPFQARTVRWMLRREGKRLVPRAAAAGPGGQAVGAAAAGAERDTDADGDVRMHEDAELDGDGPVAGPAPTATDGDDDLGADDRAPPVLADLDAAALEQLKRGPLWERVALPLLPFREEGQGQQEQQPNALELWLNRTTLAFSERDPLELMAGSASASGVATPVKEEEEQGGAAEGGDGEGEAQGAHASKKIVGGQEGHGLLAEEVGLGKTVEVLSLVLIHADTSRRKLPPYFNPVTDSEVQPSGMTLIIAPTAIVGQWQAEIARLAPSLRVLRYEGVKNLKEAHTAAYLAKRFDVVLTTFDVLRKEVVFARAPTKRGLRNKREIRYRRSLLVELDFLRVVMDEAQMCVAAGFSFFSVRSGADLHAHFARRVGDAVGPTSETASLISRRFSWAVTSTPLRDKIADLKPLLTFLRVEPIASGRATLQRLLEETPSFKRRASRSLSFRGPRELTQCLAQCGTRLANARSRRRCSTSSSCRPSRATSSPSTSRPSSASTTTRGTPKPSAPSGSPSTGRPSSMARRAPGRPTSPRCCAPSRPCASSPRTRKSGPAPVRRNSRSVASCAPWPRYTPSCSTRPSPTSRARSVPCSVPGSAARSSCAGTRTMSSVSSPRWRSLRALSRSSTPSSRRCRTRCTASGRSARGTTCECLLLRGLRLAGFGVR